MSDSNNRTNVTTHATPAIPTVAECLTLLDEAIVKHGEYMFCDRGPSDVMDVYSLGVRFERGDPVAAAAVLRSLAHSWANARGFRANAPLKLASELVVGLQEWEALFEQPGIADILNIRHPDLLDSDSPGPHEAPVHAGSVSAPERPSR